MDHRVIEHYDGDITKVNIDPSKREKVLARYGVTAGTDSTRESDR
jgi:alkane 1-monooxygenase